MKALRKVTRDVAWHWFIFILILPSLIVYECVVEFGFALVRIARNMRRNVHDWIRG